MAECTEHKDPGLTIIARVIKQEGHCVAGHKVGDEVRPIPRLVDIEDYLDYVKNVSVVQLSDRIKDGLEGLFSMSAVPGEKTTRSFCKACGIEVDWGALEIEITMIGMMHFMDEYNFDLTRAMKCCVHEILPDDGGIVPFWGFTTSPLMQSPPQH